MDKLLFKRILIAAITILAIVYVTYLLVRTEFDIYPTENAVEITVTDRIYTNAVIIRDETYIKNNSGGVLSYSVDDGDAVKADGEIAKVFKNSDDAAAYMKVDALEEKKELLESLQKTASLGGMGIETVNSQINNDIISYLKDFNSRKILSLPDDSNNLIYSINRRQIYTGKVSNFDSQIAELDSQINQLKASFEESTQILKTDKAGYFSAQCDGYEKIFDHSNINSLTLSDLNLSEKKEIDDNVAGKIISGSNWYIACKVTPDEMRSLKLWDQNVTVLFSDASTESVLASIYKIEQDKKDGDALLILKCNYMDADLIEIRQEPIEIGLGSYEGLKVSKKAVHDDYVEKTVTDENGNKKVEQKKVQGVYVLYGSEVQFKEISIIYSANDFVLCDPEPDGNILFNGETVSLYDQVILEGDDLYDGKVIK